MAQKEKVGCNPIQLCMEVDFIHSVCLLLSFYMIKIEFKDITQGFFLPDELMYLQLRIIATQWLEQRRLAKILFRYASPLHSR